MQQNDSQKTNNPNANNIISNDEEEEVKGDMLIASSDSTVAGLGNSAMGVASSQANEENKEKIAPINNISASKKLLDPNTSQLLKKMYKE